MEILVLFHSKSGVTYRLAKAVAEGIEEVEGMKARMRRVSNTTPIEAIRAVKKYSDFYDFIVKEVPEATLDDLLETEGVAMGSPTRYGNLAPSLGNFLESTGKLWLSNVLLGKVGGVFCSSNTMHGGNETTLVTMMLPLMHLGYTIVPLTFADLGVTKALRGGTPYGPSAVSALGDPQVPSDEELRLARVFGKRLAEITKKLRS